MMQLGLLLLIITFAFSGLVMFLGSIVDTQIKKKLQEVQSFLEKYHQKNGKFPTKLAEVTEMKKIRNLQLHYTPTPKDDYRLWVEIETNKIDKMIEATKKGIRVTSTMK